MQNTAISTEECRNPYEGAPDPAAESSDGCNDGHTVSPDAINQFSGGQASPGYANTAQDMGYEEPPRHSGGTQPGMDTQPQPGPIPGQQSPQDVGAPHPGMYAQPQPGPVPGYQPPQDAGMPHPGMYAQPQPGPVPGHLPPQAPGMPHPGMYAQPQPGPVPGHLPPQAPGMPYPGMYAQPQPGPIPGYQPPQATGMPHPGMYAQPGPVPGYQPPQDAGMSASEMQNPSEGGHTCGCHGNPDAKHINHDLNRYGQLMEAVTGIMNGEPDIPKIAGIIDSYDPAFWKGAIVGVVTSILLTNNTVKGAITDTISKAFGKSDKEQ